ncbi:MAG TPA: serpin family protein [Ardenticatenaceae bacterium]|jgi:serpin B
MVVALVLLGCNSGTIQTGEPTVEPQEVEPHEVNLPNITQAEAERDESPEVAGDELQTLVAGNNAFAWDVYQQLRAEEGNLFYSPYSISLALAMTYAGARGETEQQMAQTLHFDLPQEQLHPAFNALDLELSSLGQTEGEEETEGEADERFQLNIANALWGQQGYAFRPEFLDLLARNYGAGLGLLDFGSDPEAARQTINDWVSDATEEKIENLIPEGVLNGGTRLVLTNAIYFTAAWASQFEESATMDRPFHLLDGGEVSVPMMAQTESYRYVEGEGYQAIELPYRGADVSFVAILPAEGEFEAFEAALSGEQAESILGSLAYEEVVLTMPKFTYESAFSLVEILKAMGMPAAFDAADFSGMDGTQSLAISEVLHKAFIAVDEEGTEAAAATAVAMTESAAMPPEDPAVMVLDRPFIYLIRDNATGTLLFIGRLTDPS